MRFKRISLRTQTLSNMKIETENSLRGRMVISDADDNEMVWQSV